MKAIMLAAGSGTRLLPLTQEIPKCLVSIGEEVILERQLRAMEKVGVGRVVIVGGVFVEKIEAFIYKKNYSLDIRVIFNPFYARSNNLASLWFAKEEMSEPLILVMSDLVFDEEILRKGLHASLRGEICFFMKRMKEYEKDSMKLEIQNNQVINLGKNLSASQVGGMSLQMVLFSQRGALKMRDMIEQMVHKEENLDQFYTIAVKELINGGLQVTYIDMGELYWYEIDEVDDLKKVKERFCT